MAQPITPNTTGRTGREMHRKARRVYKLTGLSLDEEAARARDEATACLKARGRPVFVIAAAMCIHECTVWRRVQRWKRRQRAD